MIFNGQSISIDPDGSRLVIEAEDGRQLLFEPQG